MRLLRLCRAAVAVSILTGFWIFWALPAVGQVPTGYVQVTGANLTDSSGVKLGNGTIAFAPVNNSGQPISYQINGAGQSLKTAVTTLVTTGAFSIQLADTALTKPVNICFSVTVTDNTNGRSILGPGYECFQPAGSGAAVTSGMCTAAGGGAGGTCNFDLFQPNLPGLVVQQTGPTGPVGPPGPTGPTGPQGPSGGPYTGVISDGANGLTVTGGVAASTLSASSGVSTPALTVSGTGCGAGTYAKADGTGCGTAVTNLHSPGPIGDITPSTGSFSSVNNIPAATLAYVDPTSSIQTQINSNAAAITANTTAISGKAASNAATTVNGVSCVLSGTCTVTAAALTPVGAWVSTNAYVPGNLVTYSGANYSCISGCVAGVTPTTTANWMPIYGTTISLSSAQTWTALQTFNGGVAGTRVSYTQATPSSSAGFSNFGGAQNNGGSGLNGGITVYDNGSTWSEGLTAILKTNFGVALYANNTTQAANVFLCPSASGAVYPTLQSSLNCNYTFAATGMTTTLPINAGAITSTAKVSASQATPANSAGFSNFGGAQFNGGSGLNGGLTVYDNGSTRSQGLASMSLGGNFGIGLYTNWSTALSNVFLCPSPTGAPYPVLTTSFNCPYTFAATGMTTTLPFNVGALTSTAKVSALQATPANSSGFSNFGGTTSNGSNLAGGITVVDNGSTWSEGVAFMYQGGSFGIGLYTNYAPQATNVWLCPSPAGAPYPTAQGSFNCPYIFTTTGATFNQPLSVTGSLTANGPVAVASPSAAAGGGLTISDPIAPTQAATSVYVTLATKAHRELPVKSPVTYSATYHAFGESITQGTGSTSCAAGGDCYVQVLARAIGATATNYGVGGDYSCDASKKVFNDENPGASSNPVYTVMVGSNDLTVKGTGAYEAVFNLCHPAVLSWLAVQSGNKVAGSTFTGSGFVNDTQYSQITGTQSSTNGATATGSITTYGGPIYLWYEIIDGNGGTFTYSLNGGTPVSVNAFTPVPIATTNGTTRSVAMLRITPPAAGVQSLAITVTSPTGAGNLVCIIGMGTPQRNAYYVGPIVAVSSIAYQLYDGRSAGTAKYTLNALANQQQLAADGLDVRFTDIRTCMQDGMSTELVDSYHPNPAGHASIAGCFISVLQSVPGRNVNRGTPASSAAACTQNDLWSDSNYVYACVMSGQITRAALTAF